MAAIDGMNYESASTAELTIPFRRRVAIPRPVKPLMMMSMELGSWTAANGKTVGVSTIPPIVTESPPLKPLLPCPPVPALHPMPMVSIIIVTLPLSAKARPQPIVAAEPNDMLVSARIFPSNDVLEPMVALLATFQNIPAPAPVLITFTVEPEDVISELSNWNTQAALAFPWPSSVTVPVKLLTANGTVYTPGKIVSPTKSALNRVPPPRSPKFVRAMVRSNWACAATAVVVWTNPPVTCGSAVATPGEELNAVIEVPGETPTLPTTVLVGTLVTAVAPRIAKLSKVEPIMVAAVAVGGPEMRARAVSPGSHEKSSF